MMSPPEIVSQLVPAQPLARPRTAPALSRKLLLSLLDRRSFTRMRFVVDLVVLYSAASAALFASPRAEHGMSPWLAALFPLVVVALLSARRNPDDRVYGSLLDTLALVVGALSLAAMLLIAFDSILSDPRPLGLAIRLWLFSLVYLGVARAVLLWLRRQAVRVERLATPTLIIGAGLVGEQLVRRLAGDARYGMRPVGFVDPNPVPRDNLPADGPHIPVLGGIDQLEHAITRTGARRLILAFSSEPDRTMVAKVRECQERGLEVMLVPRLYEAMNDRATLDHLGGMPLIALRQTDPHSWQFVVKHAFDRAFAGVALLLLLPLMLTLAAAVKLTSPGPVLFRQRRVGRDGHVFDLLKFRTMREPPVPVDFVPASGLAPGGVEGEDRRTAIGRFLRGTSLDELPQLINVLRGEMSIVGPRPERPEFVQRFALEVARYEERHRVKSGITGWAQVNGLRGQTSIADRVEWDNYYIQNWSLRLDFRIILMTLAEVLRCRG